ncbi:hypothetical protein VHEMI03328 [[Torrubiella] hemipterigena]|uniref:Translation initiation factor IF-3 n=1 Tax=[Torrubiella] hemipterigena TaxID=1531966 RepID=A0A0A1TAI4_9HYPO|nr:hypothetical protein VHEMI03328 [[Torrubiella] hemipterigena]
MSTLQGAKCLRSTHRALFRSVWPLNERCAARLQRRPSHVPDAQHSTALPQTQVRFYAGPGNRRKAAPTIQEQVEEEEENRKNRKYDPRFMTQRDIERSGKDRLPQDHEITDPQVMVLENGIIEGPIQTKYVLSKLEAGESLRMIQAYVPADGKADPPMAARYAVCKIVDKKAEYDRMKQIKDKKKATGAKKLKMKELDFTWGIEEHDLMTKMRVMAKLLEKGHKVETVIAPRKRGSNAKVVLREDMDALIKKIREEADQAGGRETKPAEGKVGGMMRFQFERRGNA